MIISIAEKITSKKEYVFVLILGFFLGCGMMVSWMDVDPELGSMAMPKRVMIKREGKPLAYALTSMDYAKIVNMTDVPDPGVYLAFPIYGDRNSVDRMLS